MNDSTGSTSPETVPRIIYILYLVAIIIGLTSIIGVVMAYVYRSDAAGWLQSHYRFQIRTFWIGILYCLIGGLIISLVPVPGLIMLLIVLWLGIRCVKGLKLLSQQQPHPDPATWLF